MRQLRIPELMDQPIQDPSLHAHALRGLRRLNRLSATVSTFWSLIQNLTMTESRPLRLLDVATGAGDLPIGLWRRAHRARRSVEIDACDVSATAVDYAREHAAASGAQVRFFQLDALQQELPRGYDIVTCSLFLHHLDRDQAVALLAKMQRATRRWFLISDLARSRIGWAMAFIATRLVTCSTIVRTDALRSVRAAYTVSEVQQLIHQAGLSHTRILRHWPCRYLLIGETHAPYLG